MKNGFIRLVFGDCTKEGTKFNSELRESIQKSRFDYCVYVYGKDNYEYLKTLGIEEKCKLVDNRPNIWDMVTQLHRHKIEAYRIAMEDDAFDEFVFLDWDLIQTRDIPDNIWDRMREKDEIQSCGNHNKVKQSPWRTVGNQRYAVTAPFIYMRNKNFPREIIKIWEHFGTIKDKYPHIKLQENDEISIAYFIDELTGGWKGIDVWWERFETMFSNLPRKSFISQDKLDQKTQCFIHKLY